MTVTVKQIGGSVAVVIPKSVARELEISAGSALDILTSGESIVMRKAQSRHRRRRVRRTIAAVVSQIKSSSYRRRRRDPSTNLGPIGKEIW